MRTSFAPILIETHHIEPCFAYRHKRADESLEQYGLRAADALEAKIKELGAESVIAFVAETVVGATAGAVAPAPGYFKRIREICDRNGILLILDEVMSGMGRTGTLHACEQEGISPDLMTIAKGLGAGYQPIGATLLSQKIFDAFKNGSGFFQHGHTYIGHPLACAAALAVQKVIETLGGKIEAFYFVYGDDDVYVIADFPDAASGLALSLAVNASGVVTVTTVPLITVEEMDAACEKHVAYKAPAARQ